MSQDPKKYVWIQRYKIVDGERIDMGIVDIPEDHVAMTLRVHPDWHVVDNNETNDVKPPAGEGGLACPVCGKEYKTEAGLQKHQEEKHATA